MKLFNVQPPVVIFSTYRTERTKQQNHDQHLRAVQFLRDKDVPFKELLGRFSGEEEESILVTAEHLMVAKDIAWTTGQDYILQLDEYRNAELLPMHGLVRATTRLGKLFSSRHQPRGDYSYDQHTGIYYYVAEV